MKRLISAMPSSICWPCGEKSQLKVEGMRSLLKVSAMASRANRPRRFTQGPRLVDTVTSGEVVTMRRAKSLSPRLSPQEISARNRPSAGPSPQSSLLVPLPERARRCADQLRRCRVLCLARPNRDGRAVGRGGDYRRVPRPAAEHQADRQRELLVAGDAVAMGNLLTDKYAEGIPHHRFYAGCDNVDSIEDLANARACELFGADARLRPAAQRRRRQPRRLLGHPPRARRGPDPGRAEGPERSRPTGQADAASSGTRSARRSATSACWAWTGSRAAT